VVNTGVEPDVLVRSVQFDRPLRSLKFDGTDFWGIVEVLTASVVRIDATTGRILETFELPDEDVTWLGLTFVDDDLYLLGYEASGDNRGVIVKSSQSTASVPEI
jgi:hypothetical protein